MEVVWSEGAIADLRGIHNFIAAAAPIYAERLAMKIYDSVSILFEFPDIGRAVPEFANPEIRELIVDSYRLMYSRSQSRIDIVTVIHASRDVLRHIERADFVIE